MVRALFETQKNYLDEFFANIDFEKTEKILQKFLLCRGNIILSGVGKSGIIANKLAMTMLSTGTKAIFLSPGDALHGDIGIVAKDDIFVAISKSGETKELLELIPYIRKKGAELIAIVSNPDSTLAKLSDLFISLYVKKEICPFNLSPTTSTAAQLIYGDVLSVALMKKKNFSLDEYAINHPSGSIGKKITLRVEDLMLKGDDIPFSFPEDELIDVLHVLSSKRCGSLVVVNEKKELLGVFTDGDLRRAIESSREGFLSKKIKSFMTKTPKWITKDELAYEAMLEMEKDPKKLITVLPVIEKKEVVGIIRLHDILQSGIRD